MASRAQVGGLRHWLELSVVSANPWLRPRPGTLKILKSDMAENASKAMAPPCRKGSYGIDAPFLRATGNYPRQLTGLGMTSVSRRSLGWRMWWSGP